MHELQDEKERTIQALRKWKQGLINFHVSRQHDRTILLNSILLQHSSFLRLAAPMELLQELVYRLEDRETVDAMSLADVLTWSRQESADEALGHACATLSLLEKETARQPDNRASFSVLAPLALHHAAVVMWAYSSTRTRESSTITVEPLQDAVGSDLQICKENVKPLLDRFAVLYPTLCPAWNIHRSFAIIALHMGRTPCPSSIESDADAWTR